MTDTVHDAWLQRHAEDQTAFLHELVRMPTDTPPGDNQAAAERTAQLLEAMGFTVQRQPVPQADVHAAGLKSITNLMVRHRFGPGPVIALNAHGDVVPPGRGWSKPPYGGEIHEGRMYGRGVAVSKSDIATYAFALRALIASGASLQGTVELHLTYDEEFGGLLGPGWLLREGLSHPDLVLCAGFSYAIVTAHNGCLQLEVTLHGRSAHAAIPDTGVDALQAALPVLQALYAQRDGYSRIRSTVAGIGSPTLNIGRIDGGTNTNVVPDQLIFRLDRRLIPEEDPQAVEAELREVIAQAVRRETAQRTGVTVEVKRLLLARALRPLPGHERLVQVLSHHAQRVFGLQVEATGTPLYTDARLYGEAGIPVVLYGAGPRTIEEANAKRADENLLLSDLYGATRVVAAAVHDLLRAAA